MKYFAAICLVLLLVLATENETTRVAEARVCEAPSQKFKGICVSKRNCESVCESERFAGGVCRGFRRRCFCTRPCAN